MKPSAAQSLWKEFERSRKSCNLDTHYKECTGTGTGTLKKKRALLHKWCLDKRECGNQYRSFAQTVSFVKQHGVEAEWISKKEAPTK